MTGPFNGNGEGVASFSLSKLIKLLKLTTSDNNAEALLAMRKANDELRKLNLDWEGLLKGKITVIGDPFAEATRPPVRSSPPPTPPTTPRASSSSSGLHYSFGGLGRQSTHAKPKPSHSPPQKDITITNNFGGSCISCGTWVEPGSGKATKFAGASKFVVHHSTCQATLRKHQAPDLDQL